MLKVLAIYRGALIVYANPYLNSVKNTPCIRTPNLFPANLPIALQWKNQRKKDRKNEERKIYVGKKEESEYFLIHLHDDSNLIFHEILPPLIYLNLNLTRNTPSQYALKNW